MYKTQHVTQGEKLFAH